MSWFETVSTSTAFFLVPVALLLIKFNWVQQFSTKLDDGTTTINLKAVISMIIGYLILPIILRIYMRAKK